MKPVTIRFPDDLHQSIRRFCFEKEISINQFVIEAVKEKYEKSEGNK